MVTFERNETIVELGENTVPTSGAKQVSFTNKTLAKYILDNVEKINFTLHWKLKYNNNTYDVYVRNYTVHKSSSSTELIGIGFFDNNLGVRVKVFSTGTFYAFVYNLTVS